MCWDEGVLICALSSAIANQESLSGLETEMRKIEALVKELIDDMTYLKKREERFRKTNSEFYIPHVFVRPRSTLVQSRPVDVCKTLLGSPLPLWVVLGCGRSCISGHTSRRSISSTRRAQRRALDYLQREADYGHNVLQLYVVRLVLASQSRCCFPILSSLALLAFLGTGEAAFILVK
jgi:emp24/gp25L/p24 family/GOLD